MEKLCALVVCAGVRWLCDGCAMVVGAGCATILHDVKVVRARWLCDDFTTQKSCAPIGD